MDKLTVGAIFFVCSRKDHVDFKWSSIEAGINAGPYN